MNNFIPWILSSENLEQTDLAFGCIEARSVNGSVVFP